MLKSIIITIFSIAITSLIWAILMVVEIKLMIFNTTDLNVKRSYGGLQVADVFWGTLVVIGILYLISSFFFKILLKRRHFHLFWIGLFTALINALIWYTLTNTLVMVRPSFKDPMYLRELCFAFTAGFILPFAEWIIEKIAKRFEVEGL